MSNSINPDHYKQGEIECIEYIEDNMSHHEFQGYCKGNVTKYLHRWRDKGGVEDLEKAKWYLDRMIKSAIGETYE